MLIVGVIGVALAVAVAVWAVGSQFEERAAIRSTLRRLDGYDVASERDQELLQPVTSRAIAPVLKRVVEFGRAKTPVGYLEKVRRKHVRAGRPTKEAVDSFMVLKVLGIASVPVSFFLVFFLLKLSGILGIALFGLFALAGILGPDARLNSEVEERSHQVRIALPDILDLLVISVEAGLGFEQALDRTIDAVPGPLTDEFARMLGEVRAGSSRADAMRAMEARLDVAEVRSFILAILQADTFGVSIGRVLRAQADEMRVKRRQMAQEKAQKAPVKMLIPMVFCIFPALFIVILGPAALNIYDNVVR